MSLYLVRFQHQDENVTCCLVRACGREQAFAQVDKWLSQDCRKIDTDLYMDLEDKYLLRIEGISEIDKVDDLEKYLPLINRYWPQEESLISTRNN